MKEIVSPIRDENNKTIFYLSTSEDITESRHLSARLNYQASHDILTGLLNRSEFELRLKSALETTEEFGYEHALCYLDLDQFKVINDTCGHVAGDELLRQVSKLLLKEIGKYDTLARLGGDEFGMLLDQCSLEDARRIASQIISEFESFQFVWEENTFRIGVSIGLVPIRTRTTSVNILKTADSACYIAKDRGRNRIHILEENDEVLARRHGEMQWVSRINTAMNKDLFRLYHKTILPLNYPVSYKLHCELLIRMDNEQGGTIAPGLFLPAAERYNLSPQLDRWVIDTAFNWLCSDYEIQMQLSKCCINLSGLTLGNDKILDFITRRLDETGIAAEKICFEITETAAATSDAHHIKDAADCNEVIEHHCKDMDEAATEKCLVDWHEHHAKEAAHELENHKECVDLILELEHEPH